MSEFFYSNFIRPKLTKSDGDVTETENEGSLKVMK